MPAQRKLIQASFKKPDQIRFRISIAGRLFPTMLTATSNFQLVSRDITRSLNTTADQPQVARETAYYSENIGNVETIEDFVADDRLFAYAMKAHGLEEMTFARALMRKALEEGIDNTDALANQLADVRYRDFVETFNFVRHGTATTAFDRTGQGTIDKYVRQTLEDQVGEENQGTRLALYFQRKAPEIDSAFGLLADPALLRVTQTALSIPPESAVIDIDRQAREISERLDIEDLKDPDKLTEFLNRFTSLWDIENPTTTPQSALQIFGPSQTIGIGADILTSLQSVRLAKG